MLRVCVIGPGNIDFHFFELLKMPQKKFWHHAEQIAQALTESGVEIVLLPDFGVSFEVAKQFRQKSNRQILGTVPFSDTNFGIAHLKPQMEEKIGKKKLFDNFIDTHDWYKQDMSICIFGDVVLMLGNSLGTMRDLTAGFYLYKLFSGGKKTVSVLREKIHGEARAGGARPFSVIVYQPFFKEKLNSEIEKYIQQMGCQIFYAKNAAEIKKSIAQLEQARLK